MLAAFAALACVPALMAGCASGASADGNSTPSATPSASSTSDAVSAPTLGRAGWATGTKGFGSVEPKRISNGGDPTGIVFDIAWKSWGKPHADGTAHAYYEAPGKPVSQSKKLPARIRAFKLDECNGKPAYRRVVWWFPSKGQTFQSARAAGVEAYDLCTGKDIS